MLGRAGLFDEAHAAVHLQAHRGHLDAHVGGPGLGDRRQQFLAQMRAASRSTGLAAVRARSAATAVARQRPRAASIFAFISISVRRTSGWSKIRDGSVAGPGRAALLALQRIGQRLLIGALGDADALHADLQPGGVHHHEHVRQALVGRADQLGAWAPS